jgi:Ca2+-binding RTX toxin-like protein
MDREHFTVRFDLPSGTLPVHNIPANNVVVHPGWDGYANDIALITLPALAPVGRGGANRFDIYRSTDEIGKPLRVVGYGATGCGTPCDPDALGPMILQQAGHDNSFGVKRQGGNQFDSTHSTFLTFDLDDQIGEVAVAPGDSGGPNLVAGRIAGVTARGSLWPLGSYGWGDAFGATSSVTRVSLFANWIDGVVNRRYDLVIDMNRQVAGNDGRGDVIQVRKNGDSLEVLVNGELYHSDNVGRINSITVRGSNDDDHLVLSHPMTTIVDGRGGNDTLQGLYQGSTWSIDGYNSGSLGNWARFSSIENLKGGAGDDSFEVRRGGSVAGSIDGSYGRDKLSYSAYSTGISVNLTNETATGMRRVLGIEDVKGGEGNDTIIGHSGDNTFFGMGGNDILDGRGGRDRLYGFGGRDLLVGGLGADTLDGGSDDDLLVSGNLNAHYSNVMSEWGRRDAAYISRLGNLRTGGGLARGSVLNHDTVPVDNDSDLLDGREGQDWFWGYANEIRDHAGAETIG